MRRRDLLRGVPATALAGTAGCLGTGRPAVRMDSGSGTLHPATELYVANGLQPDGDDGVFVEATADESPELVGPDAEGTLADTLRHPHVDDRFHVVVQLRSTPDGPMELWPASGGAFDWPDRTTLRATVEVRPWGSFDRIDDEVQRERLRAADELVFTAVWSLVPALDELPPEVALRLATRG